jgi:hypothetical protein
MYNKPNKPTKEEIDKVIKFLKDNDESLIYEKGFEEGYTVARRNYEGLPIGYSKWLELGEKFGYLKFYNKQNEKLI